MLSEQAKAARRAYKRAWARNNPEKIRAQQERYWQRIAAQQAQQTQAAQEEQHAPQVEDGTE